MMPPLIAQLLLLLAIVADGVYSAANDTQDKNNTATFIKCGYVSCHPVNKTILTVHLVPHSHDDVGWIKTVDQYYYGTYRQKHFAGIQYTIGSVLESLYANPERRFSQVETAYLSRWWRDQDNRTRRIYKELIDNGQLEIVNGAWSMNDEAITHYQSIVDQFAWGLKFIDDRFGSCGRPRIGWQIDPFGHSNGMATIYGQLGYDGLVMARLDYRDIARRRAYDTLEFVWQGSPSLGKRSEIFTSVMYDSYSTPQQFCYDVLCDGTAPIVDDPASPEYNLKEKADRFYEYVTKISAAYKTNNVLMPIGGDFTYQSAHMYFVNIEKLIKGMKRFYPELEIVYSTPSCYVKAVNEADEKAFLPFNRDDFLPYATTTAGKYVHYWTGYYSSRPNLKRFERMGNNLLQTAKQLVALDRMATGNDYATDLTPLRETMGVLQHHDAITGTEKQAVAQDYVRMLTAAIAVAERNVSQIITDLLRKANGTTSGTARLPPFASCLLANVTQCESSRRGEFLVAVYNPLSRAVNEYVRLPVDGDDYTIRDNGDGAIIYDVVPHNRTFVQIAGKEPAANELVFEIGAIQPHGIKLLHVKRGNGTNKYRQRQTPTDVNYYGTATTGFRIDPKTNLMTAACVNGTLLNVTQSLYYYRSSAVAALPSGAYVFRPHTNALFAFGPPVNCTAFRGRHVDEFHQRYAAGVTQTIRAYKNANYIEFDWMVGPLDRRLGTGGGIEVVSVFNASLQTDGYFYTDANGREMVRRKINWRPTYNYTNEEPIAGNYYPIASSIAIRDERKNVQLAIVNDRAQGGTSLTDGRIELMLHRRLVQDDALGVDEALNELEYGDGVVARGRHYLTHGPIGQGVNATTAAQRDVMQRKHLEPWTFVAHSAQPLNLTALNETFNFEFAGLKANLSRTVNVLTLEPWTNDSYLLRLEHVFAANAGPSLAEPIDVDLKNLFSTFTIDRYREMTIDGNQLLSDNGDKRLNWTHTEHYMRSMPEKAFKPKGVVTLRPMEIRTFIVRGKFNQDNGNNNNNNANNGNNKGDANNGGPSTVASYSTIAAFLIVLFMYEANLIN